MFHQTYLTPVRLHAMHRIPTSTFTRCTCPRADCCPVIAKYWQQVIEILTAVLSIPVACTPLVCLLGVLDEELWSRHAKTMLMETIFMARKAVALELIQPTPPSIRTWIWLGNQVLLYEKLIFEHRGCPAQYNKVWDAWCSSDLTVTNA